MGLLKTSNLAISLHDLGKLINVPIDRFVPLIAAGHLTVFKDGNTPQTMLLTRPFPEMLEWMRLMLGPVSRRPIISIADVGRMLNLKPEIIHRACEKFNVDLVEDPIFGWLMSARGFHTLKSAIEEDTSHLRLDRQALMVMLARMKGAQPARKYKLPLPYEQMLENELARIVKLPEPQRTFQGIKFWEAYHDADKLTDCLRKYDLDMFQRKYADGWKVTIKTLRGALEGSAKWQHVLRGVRNIRPRNSRKKKATSAQGDGAPASGA